MRKRFCGSDCGGSQQLLDEALEAEASVLVIAPTGAEQASAYLCGIAPMHPGQRP